MADAAKGTHQLQRDGWLVRLHGLGAGHMTTLMHAEQLPSQPAVVGRDVHAHNFSLCDGGAVAGVRGEVHGTRAAKKAGMMRIEEEGADEEAAAAKDGRRNDEVTLG
jgi:hypothetical protein